MTNAANKSQDDEFTVAAMLTQASVETGLSDFGADGFEEPFQRLLDSVKAEVALSPMGLMGFKADVQRLLVNRLRFADDLKKHPEILDEDVSDPIVVLGLVRTGTTKLQRMMAADPDVQRLEFWRLYNPAPLQATEPSASGGNDPRIALAHQVIGMLQQISPGFMAAHPTQAEEVDEELLLQEFTFKTNVHYLRNPAHGYYRWLQSQPLDDTYRYLKRSLQYLQWQDGSRGGKSGGRPWILKSPMHIGNLELLIDVFPKATLVHCHRDVTEVIPSFCRLMETGWRMKTDAIDAHLLGQAGLALWSEEMRKYLEQRDRLGSRVDIYDVRYEAVKDDPISVIREIYRRAGRVLTPAREQAMQQWAAENPQNRHGKNSYCMEEFGLTADAINSAFKDYIDRFGR